MPTPRPPGQGGGNAIEDHAEGGGPELERASEIADALRLRKAAYCKGRGRSRPSERCRAWYSSRVPAGSQPTSAGSPEQAEDDEDQGDHAPDGDHGPLEPRRRDSVSRAGGGGRESARTPPRAERWRRGSVSGVVRASASDARQVEVPARHRVPLQPIVTPKIPSAGRARERGILLHTLLVVLRIWTRRAGFSSARCCPSAGRPPPCAPRSGRNWDFEWGLRVQDVVRLEGHPVT